MVLVHSAQSKHSLLHDFLGLGLIGVVYSVSELLGAWGFLAVFFSAVALRNTEHKLNCISTQPRRLRTDASCIEDDRDDLPHHAIQTVSDGSLVFKEHMERLSEVILIILVGGTLFLDSRSLRSVGFALFLFIVARPVSVLIALLASRTLWKIRLMVGWFVYEASALCII